MVFQKGLPSFCCALLLAASVPTVAGGAEQPVIVLFSSDPADATTGIKVTEYRVADDFELTQDGAANCASFLLGDWDGSFPATFDGLVRWWLYLDEAGAPGQLVTRGTAYGIDVVEEIPAGGSVYTTCYRIAFNLGQVLDLEAGPRYWLALNVNQGFDPGQLFSWVKSASSFFSPAHFDNGTTGWTASGIDLTFDLVRDPGSTFYLFADSFETGDLSIWSATVP